MQRPVPSFHPHIPSPFSSGRLLKPNDQTLLVHLIRWVGLALLILSVGCRPEQTESAAYADLQPGAVLFADDFSHIPNGWGVWNREGSQVDYYNSGLRILVGENQFDFWSVSGHRYTDIQVEADAIKHDGPDDNDFGLICRYRSKDNFYTLLISSDGYYGIAKMKDGQYSMIGSDQLQYTAAIAQGQATNHLRADCIGSTLTLYANGQKLMEVHDAEFTAGDVGVLAGSYSGKGVDIIFDNFVVKKP